MDEVSEKAECMYLLVGLYALRYLRILFFTSHALIYCPSTSHHMKFENFDNDGYCCIIFMFVL